MRNCSITARIRTYSALAAAFAVVAAVTFCHPVRAIAADLTPKYKAPVVVTTSPFYLRGEAGVAWSAQQNDLTTPGLDVMGSPKEYPAGAMVGLGFGVQAPNSPIGFIAVEANIDRMFARASIGCQPGFGCAGFSKDSWRFTQEVMWSPFPTPAQWVGQLPSSAQPANWPIPITTSGSWLSAVMFLPKFGVAERGLDVCATNTADAFAAATTSACDTRWLIGPTAGLRLVFALSAQADITADYNFDWYKTSINSANSPIFGTDTFHVQNAQVGKIGFNYHF